MGIYTGKYTGDHPKAVKLIDKNKRIAYNYQLTPSHEEMGKVTWFHRFMHYLFSNRPKYDSKESVPTDNYKYYESPI